VLPAIELPAGIKRKRFSYLAPVLKEIVGDEVWQAVEQGSDFEVKIEIKNNES
jgi:hypothetical protein